MTKEEKKVSLKKRLNIGLVLVTMMVLVIFSIFYTTKEIQLRNERNNSIYSLMLGQAISNVENEITRLKEVSNVFMNSPILNETLIDMELNGNIRGLYGETLSPVLFQLHYSDIYIGNIYIFSNYVDTRYFCLRPMSDLGIGFDIGNLMDTGQYYRFFFREGKLYVVARPVSQSFSALLVVEVRWDKLLAECMQGEWYEGFEFSFMGYKFTYGETRLQSQHYLSNTSEDYDMTLIAYVKNEELATSLASLLLNYIPVAAITILMVLPIGLVMIKFLFRKIRNIDDKLTQVEQGDFTVHIDVNSNDEIGDVSVKFNSIVERMRESLEREVIKSTEMEKLRAELLVSQIKPHFLYNVLSSVNCYSQLGDVSKTSDITNWLSTFYRTSLNKGKMFSTVNNEIMNIMVYMELELAMFPDLFKFKLLDDSDASRETVPNFILQPFIENSIVHGFVNPSGIPYMITVSIINRKHSVVFSIADNGSGCSEEKISEYLASSEDRNGYGLYNVRHRLELIYGKGRNYIEYSSIPYKKTEFKITIPKKNHAEFEDGKDIFRHLVLFEILPEAIAP